MGMQSSPPPPGLADALFTPVQQRVLGLLFGQPERRFQGAELIRLAQSGTGAVHRQLMRLAEVELVLVSRVGNQKYYQANRESAVFEELHGLIVKTVGLAGPLREVLDPLHSRIDVAFIYGSVALGADRATSDIDVMIIGAGIEYADLYHALQGAEQVLGRAVNPTLMTRAEWRTKRAVPDSFAARVASGSKLFVFGTDDDLT